MVLRVHCDIQREVEPSFATGSIISAITRFPITREVMYQTSVKIHSPDTIRATFCKVEVVFLFIEANVVWQGNACLNCPFSISRAPRLAVPSKRFNETKI
jgi:hypothetical protein